MLTELRTSITDALEGAGIKAFGYVGEALSPPCAVVVPSNPYFRRPDGTRAIPFRKVLVGVDVLLLVPRGDAKAEAKAIDDLLESAYRALNPNHDIGTAARPGVVTVSGSKFIGSVLSIEALTEEP